MILYIILLIFFIISTGFFAGIETGLVSCNKIKMKILEEQGSKRAGIVNKLIKNPDELLSATLIGTNISVVSASILFTTILSNYINFNSAMILSTAILTPTLLIFSEVLPKSAFLANSTRYVIKLAHIFWFFFYFFKPISLFIMGFSRFLMKLFHVKKSNENFYLNKDTMQQVFQWGASEGILDEEEKNFIKSILATHKILAKEIMTPLIDVISIELDESLNKVIELMDNHNYTRIPVFEKRVDNIVGYVSCQDLIYSNQDDTIREVIRECSYVPETVPVDFLIVELQRLKVPIVFVVDEYGGCSGVITNEDIAEVIIGEILDEHEIDENIIFNNDGSVIVDAKVDVDDLNEKFGLGINKKGFETIGGFILYALGHIPDRGERVETKNFRYTVLSGDNKSISRILIEGKLEKIKK